MAQRKPCCRVVLLLVLIFCTLLPIACTASSGQSFTPSVSPALTSAETPSPSLVPAVPLPTAVTAGPSVAPTRRPPTPTPKRTALPTRTPKATVLPTPTPQLTPSPTPQPTATATPSPSPTATAEPTPSPTLLLTLEEDPVYTPPPPTPTERPEGLLPVLRNFSTETLTLLVVIVAALLVVCLVWYLKINGNLGLEQHTPSGGTGAQRRRSDG